MVIAINVHARNWVRVFFSLSLCLIIVVEVFIGFFLSIFTFNLIFWVLSWLMLLMGFPLFWLHFPFIFHLFQLQTFFCIPLKNFSRCALFSMQFTVVLLRDDRCLGTKLIHEYLIYSLKLFLGLKWKDQEYNSFNLMKDK